MGNASFVHLHLHTHYSLLDGATRIEALIQRAKEWNMPAVAISDHGNMFGVVEFYSAALKAGIKPILGCEAYLAAGDRRAKDPGDLKESFHLLLLAMNRQGYQNLMRLSTIGYTEGFYRKPRIDKTVLREYSEGLICTSTCLGGEIPQTMLHRDRAAAEVVAKTYLEIFGPDRFFIELQDHNLADQKTLNPELVDMARRLGVGTIATNDVHYLDPDDAEAHDVLCCINTGSLVADTDRFKFDSDQFYFKSGSEMAALFPAYPEAIANTLHLAELCNVELELGKRHAPVFRVPEAVHDENDAPLTAESYLRRLVYDGAEIRYGTITPELRQRIDYELGVIIKKGFAGYFLIVWDCVQYARAHGIPAGARGSACSAVVSYCLGISAPDPIRYELYFERFMDPDRDEMPDIDLDICQNGRAELIDYVREKYGHVAQIITFGTLKAKAVVKDVARVLGVPFNEANELTKLIPQELHINLDKALAQEPELKKRYQSDATVRRILDIGRRLEGVARNAGVHAAGVVIADQPLVDFLPLYRSSGQDALVTQFDGPTVEKVGLLKMDFLGLRTLTTLERARVLAERSSGHAVEFEPPGRRGPGAGPGTPADRENVMPAGEGGAESPIPFPRFRLDDPKVYDLFARGETQGIFQFESGGMRDVIMRMKPNRIEDLIAANALYRPGPMEYIPDYIARKHGQSWITPHPIMTEVLAETYGVMVYQEQVSRIVNRLGGIELKSAFRLAKAISKKKTDMIEAMREPFLGGCAANGIRREVAERVFEDILKFGGYAFNKAHSTGYALVAYQTAWMKTYYPVEFMAALMTFEMSSIEKVAEYREECRSMAIAIEPPDINASAFDFVVESAPLCNRTASDAPPKKQLGARAQGPDELEVKSGKPRVHLRHVGPGVDSVGTPENGHEPGETGSAGNGVRRGTRPREEGQPLASAQASIRFGLGAVKGVGEKAAGAIVSERRRGGSFRDLFDFCERVDLNVVNKGCLEALICAGAFDRTGWMRKALFDALEGAMQSGQQAQNDRRSGQMTMFGAPDPTIHAARFASRVAAAAEWSEAEMLAREKQVLGFYITRHPLTQQEHLLTACGTSTTVDLSKYKENDRVIVGGMVSSLRTVTVKTGRQSGRQIGILTLEDLKGKVEAILGADDLAQFRPVLTPDAVVFLEGTVDTRREEPSLRVTRVVPADQAIEAFARTLLLNVRSDQSFEDLAGLLRTHRGECPVYLNVETTDGQVAQIECGLGYRVKPNGQLLNTLKSRFGRGAIQALGPNRRAIPL